MTAATSDVPLGWLGIVRLGLVQTALGAIVLIVTSTMNRVMVVEWGLPALVPGSLVALHYAVQLLRPRLGHGSDIGGRRTPWIIGGMAVLAGGGVLAALATAWMSVNPACGIALAVMAFILVGLGVGASGTALLVLLSRRVAPARRPAAATIVWMMMLLGFAVTAGVVGKALEPFSAVRLVAVTAGVGIVALAMTVLATWRIEPAAAAPGRVTAAPPADFRRALAQVWAEPVARRFTVFVFVSMFAYSAQELLLEPFAGAVYHLTPGGSAQLAGLLHGGVFGGMLIVAVLGTMLRRRRASMRGWAIGGCAGSALALLGLTGACVIGPAWPLSANVVVLGVANGCFVIAAIGSMMDLAGSGARPDGQGAGQARDGVRMGLWGAAQAIAFALGGLAGTSASDFARHLLGSPIAAYATVFAVQAVLFLLAAWQANLVFRNLVFRPGRARSADQTQANHTQPHGQRRPDPQMRDGGAVVAIQG